MIRGDTVCWLCVTYGGASLGDFSRSLSRKLQLSAIVGRLAEGMVVAWTLLYQLLARVAFTLEIEVGRDQCTDRHLGKRRMVPYSM